MNRLSVTVVDILGVLVPGAVLLAGCFFLPPSLAPVPALTILIGKPIPIFANPWVAGGIWLVTAYVLGFLLRLVSIPLMNRVTNRAWSGRLKKEIGALNGIFEAAIANKNLSTSLKDLAELHGSNDPGHYAPYFHFAKRLVRQYPDMWVEAERLEAEVRFVAGLFIPFLLLLADGLLLRPTAWVLVLIGAGGAVVLASCFPSRRIKEVVYNHYLALAVLLCPVHKCAMTAEISD